MNSEREPKWSATLIDWEREYEKDIGQGRKLSEIPSVVLPKEKEKEKEKNNGGAMT